jgi:DNA helicase-2/ATP-dependent DNA helicase PcrA
MLGFTEMFEEYEPRRIVLDINYRCKERIITGAKTVISQNQKRFAKNIKPFDSDNKGHLIARNYTTRENQNKAIIRYLKSENMDINKVALIYRTNQEALNMAGYLREAGISTNLDHVSKSYLENEAVDICIAYLSFAYLGNKRADFLKIMNKPMRFLSRNALTSDIVTERLLFDHYRGNREKTGVIRRLFSQINMISHLRPHLAIRFIRRDIGVEDLYKGSSDALDRFMEEAREYDDNEVFLKAILEKREAIRLQADKGKNTNKKDCVKLLTMHGSKGLEYEIVWLPDLNEGIIPSRSAETQDQIEEERRMLYVGMTRAKQALIMSYVAGTKENPMLPSRFLRPIKDLWEKSEKN